MEAKKSISEHCLIALVLKKQNVNASMSRAITAQNQSKASKRYNNLCVCIVQTTAVRKQNKQQIEDFKHSFSEIHAVTFINLSKNSALQLNFKTNYKVLKHIIVCPSTVSN